MLPIMVLVDHPWTLNMPSMAAVGSIVGMALISFGLLVIDGRLLRLK